MAPPRFARNLVAVLLWELLWGFGAACTSSAIFVPFLSQLAGSKRLVGTVGLTMLLGIPALLVSLWLGHRLRRRRVAVALLWAAQVVGWVVLGVVLTMDNPPTSSIVPIIYVTQAILAFLAGVSMAPTYQLLTSVFGDRFGTAQGLQLLFRQVSGVVGGLWAATALQRGEFPRNFGFTFLVGGIVLTASNGAVLFFVEDTSALEKTDRREDVPRFLPVLQRTLRDAKPIASFLWVIAGVACAVSAQSLLVVSALERLHLGAGYAGVFASVTLAAQGIGGVIAGRTGDRIGHARALFISLGVQLVAFALATVLVGLGQFYVALTLAGVANAAMQIGLAGLTARLAPADAQGAFMAIMRWVVQIVSAVATAVAAFVADRAGYAVLFGTFLAPVVAAMIVVLTFNRRERGSAA
jgi:MFS family permease